MIKKGDIIKGNNDELYSITNEKVYCVALTDEVMNTEIKVMVIEDNRFTAYINKAIGKVFSMHPRYFDVVDYTDANAIEKEKVLKMAMKLCKRSTVAYECINGYIEDRQIGIAMISPSMYWGYASDNGKKFTILEFNLSYSSTDLRVETLYKYTINCKDIGTENYHDGIVTLGRLKGMINGGDRLMNGVKLYDRVWIIDEYCLETMFNSSTIL